MKTTKELLIDAAHLILERGWNHGAVLNCRGGMCLMGAVIVAITDVTSEWDEGFYLAQDVLRKTIKFRSLAAWNDNPRRTADEVIDALYEAADSL